MADSDVGGGVSPSSDTRLFIAMFVAIVIIAAGAVVGLVRIATEGTTASGLPQPGATDLIQPATAPPMRVERPAHVVSPGHAAGLTSMPWKLVGVRDHATVLDIYYVAGGGCTSPRGLYVQQTAQTVLIAALGKTNRPPGAVCPSNLRVGLAAVTLRAPLGTRHLVHAVVDPAWNLPGLLRA